MNPYTCVMIDGDGLEEIVVQQLVDELGGAGQYSSRIFQSSR